MHYYDYLSHSQRIRFNGVNYTFVLFNSPNLLAGKALVQVRICLFNPYSGNVFMLFAELILSKVASNIEQHRYLVKNVRNTSRLYLV